MAARKKPKTRLRIVTAPALSPGDAVWVYLRHSPGEDQTIISQRRDVERFVAEQQLAVLRWYIDEAKTASAVEGRDAFEEMLADSQHEPPPVKAVIVWDLSRFSRDDLEAQFYSADLRMRGYQIVSIKDDIPAGEFSGIFEAFIRWKNSRFLRDLQAATLRGLDAVVHDRVTIDGVERTGFAAGGFPPRGYVARTVQVGMKPSGKPLTRTYWELTADGDLRSRVETAWRMAIDAARQGERAPVAEIHRRAHIFADTSSYYDFLRTVTYAGVRYAGSRRVEGAHEAYITLEEFALVQRALQAPPRITDHPRRIASPFPLSGRVFCAYCGAPVNYSPDPRRPGAAYLVCSRRKNLSSSCTLSKLNARTFMAGVADGVRRALLEDATLEAITRHANGHQDVGRLDVAKERKSLQREMARLDESVGRLVDALEAGSAPELIGERLAQRERERGEVARRLADLPSARAPKPRILSKSAVQAIVSELLEEEDAELLRAVVAGVELENDSGRVSYSLPLRVFDGYPVADSNGRTWLRRPALYPLS